MAWLCSHCDKAERLSGPEPLARLSAGHAPFPSRGRLPCVPGRNGQQHRVPPPSPAAGSARSRA